MSMVQFLQALAGFGLAMAGVMLGYHIGSRKL